MRKLTREKAYVLYRSDPAAFFSHRIHITSGSESELINPDWPRYWTKYHYNLVENGILEILHEHKKTGKKLSVLDAGVGTGHWLEFYRSLFPIKKMVGVDFCKPPLQKLKEKINDKKISLLLWDISTDIPRALQASRFDIVNAIGVIFHIVDDVKWQQAIRNLFTLLEPGGILIAGGDFSSETKERGAMRKSRSLHTWLDLLNQLNGKVVALKRYNWWAGADNNGITDNLLAIQK
ncbi:MAG TPA: class I SAM-dependent methyltransferase [Chitinophagales bacterium]|nr:class I SAM-dependent methyltransferase [Chitinophagales bacterium]